MAGVLWARQRSASPELAGFRVQSSVYGLPIPIVYGTARIAANLIDFVKGATVPIQSQRSKWTSATTTGWTYLNAVALGLCEGTIVGIGNVWADKDAKADFATIIQPRDLWTLKTGTLAPAALGYLSSLAPYQYVAYVAADNLAMPNNVLPNYSWEVKGLHIFGSGVVDALPSDVLPDLLTDPVHGAFFPSSSLDSLTEYEDYCAAAGLFVSPAITALGKVADVVDQLMIASNSAVVWSDGLLKVKPYGDQPLSGHGHTYTPNVDPIYDLSDVDFLANEGEDPVVVTRKNPNECYNQLALDFENRANDYNGDTKEAKNDEDILATRLRPAPKLSIPMIKDPDVARTVVQLRQQREQFIVNEYGFKLGWKFSLLEPMDLVTLTDEGLGLDFTVVRVTSVVELADAQGIQFTAEDWPFGAAGATLYPSQQGSGHKPANNVAPGNAVVQIIDAPPILTNAYLGIWIGASGGNDWGGCEVWYSYDNVSYYKLGEIHQKATFGTLTASLATNAPYPTVDTTHTLAVDTSVSGGSIDTVDSGVFDAELSLIWVDGEFLIYRDAALTSANHFNVTHLGRGMYASPIANPAASGRPFMVLPPAFDSTGMLTGTIFRWANPGGGLGDTIYFKFPSFNIYGNELQSLAAVSAVAHVIAVDPSVPGNGIAQGTVTVDETGATEISWQGPGWARSYLYLTSTSAFPSDAAVLAGGTSVNGRTQSVVGPTLTQGETVYATLIPFSGLSATGIAGHSFQLQGSYQNKVTAKFDTYAASFLVPRDSTAPQFTVDVSSGFITVQAGAAPITPNGTVAVKLTSGLTIDSFDMYAFSNSAHIPPTQEDVTLKIIAVNRSTQVASVVASIATSGQSGAVQFVQTTGIGHTVDTSTNAYYISVWLRDNWGDGAQKLYSFTIGYTQNTYSQGL